MSCLIGVVDKKNVYIGSESRASADGSISYFKCEKVFRNDKYLIGFCGNVRSGQVLMPAYFKPPKSIMEFPDAMREQLTERGSMSKTENGIDITESNYLIGVGGRLYTILMDFQMHEVEDYYSIGSGSYYAYGSLLTTAELEGFNPIDRITLALNAACKYDGASGPPYTIMKL